jgi:hypothetical protein
MKLFPTLAAIAVLAACSSEFFENADERVTPSDLAFAAGLCDNHSGVASLRVQKHKVNSWYMVVCTDGLILIARRVTPK